MKKIKYYILALFSVLTLCLVPVGHVSAVSDVSATYTSAPAIGDNVFPTCTDLACLSQYSYLIVEINSPVLNNSRPRALLHCGGTVYFPVSPANDFAVYSLASLKSSGDFGRMQFYYVSEFPFTSGITFTLSETYQTGITPEGTLDITSNGTFDVSNYASASVEVEESSFIVQLFSKGFWGVATAIVSLIVPVFALFLVFRLVHDFFWGRG